MKILVTGSTGFLGKHFIKFIKSKFENVEIFESNTKVNNLLDYSSLYSQLKDINFDYIFHFAAHTKAGDWCLSNAGEQWIINQQINTNIITISFSYSAFTFQHTTSTVTFSTVFLYRQ